MSVPLPTEMVLQGEGLHSGQPAAVTLRRAPGPLAIAWPSGAVTRDQLTVVRADMGVQVAGPHGERLELVEHLMAAIGALGVTEGLLVVPAGEEIPLLDGGAAAFARALRALGFGGSPEPQARTDARTGGPASRGRKKPPQGVLKEFSFEQGGASYELRPGAGVAMEVSIDFDHPAIGRQRARWDGDPDDFIERIAPARTFGFVRDLGALHASGRALGARADTALVAFGDRGPVNTELRGQDEPARHKLLDLIGDLTLYGGPLQGSVRADRPGHAATLAMMRAARAAGAVG